MRKSVKLWRRNTSELLNYYKLEELARQLLEKEVIFKQNLEEIFGKQPWDKTETPDKEQFSKKNQNGQKEKKENNDQDSSEEQVEETSENKD